MPTNILHNEYPSKPIAQYLTSGSRGIVETPDGKVYSYDNERPKGQRFVEEKLGFHPGMWLQPALSAQTMNPVKMTDPGEYPFADFELQLELKSRTYDGLTFFLRSLDTDFEPEDREMFARRATHLLKEDTVRAEVEPVLIRNPMPPGFDTTYGPKEGKAGEILQAMIDAWRPADPTAEREYVVSFRRGKKMADLSSGNADMLVEFLQTAGITIVEVMPTGETVVIRASTDDARLLHAAIHATCHIVPRSVGTVGAS
ncbi:MAG: hypothetical protein KBD06_04435 [Candidatus Pacebacteria bacterium]|nr:hypothetical protein [Candidatus Paceibacterota bacterium]